MVVRKPSGFILTVNMSKESIVVQLRVILRAVKQRKSQGELVKVNIYEIQLRD
jgi:hypothetical protein